jgi:hypothetical protein
MKKKTKKIAKRIGTSAGIIGGVAAAGYAASRLLRHSQEVAPKETPAEMNLRDADRALDYEPGSNFDFSTPSRDVVGDPSARTSVGLESGGGI